jgi:hypothetical protein
MADQLLYPPVQGRQCGDCHACCQYLKINTPELKKLPNVLCANYKDGCTIFDRWPTICRTFFCGWRVTQTLGDEWRPDRSNVMIVLHEPRPGGQDIDLNILGKLSEEITLKLLNYVSDLMRAGFTVYAVVPGAPGHHANKLALNEQMAPAIAGRNLAHARAVLNEAIRICASKPTPPMVLGELP